jgi:hypothetical protein
MNKQKIGTLFMVLILALTGVGISYAGLTDTITVFGTVSTARVQFEDLEYTGTWVYKIHGLEGSNEYGYEIYVDKDDIGQDAVEDLYPDNNVELISWAESSPGTGDYDVDVDYYNLMPGIDYVADLHFNIGTIPVIVNKLEYSYDADSEIEDLVTNGDIWASMYTDTGKTVEDGTQIHPNERVSLELYIEIPQNNDYQGKSGSFTFEMGIIQWTDPCDEEIPPPDIVRFPEVGTAYIGYEDRPTGSDFDYNDFGMNMEIEEMYADGVLESIYMKYTSVVNRAGDKHDIHIFRSLNGDYTYNITRSDAATGTETPEVTIESGSDDFDIVLFDTDRWPNNDGQVMGQWVEIEITIDSDNEENLLTDFVGGNPDRWDLDDMFRLYDPWMNNRGHGNQIYIDSWQDAASPLPLESDDDFDVPYIIVVPVTDWDAPDEGQVITIPYPDFDEYYRTEDAQYEDWYIP